MRLKHLLNETINAKAKITKLTELISQVAKDYNTILNIGNTEEIPEDDFGSQEITIDDPNDINKNSKKFQTILWLTIRYSLRSGKITEYSILAGPTEDQQWDIVDMSLQDTYEDFLSQMSDLPVEPPTKDYGIDILNIISWVISAHKQLIANPTDPNSSFEFGYYRVEVTIKIKDGGKATTRYWLEASSADDAKQQMIDKLGKSLLGAPRVVQFTKEKLDWE